MPDRFKRRVKSFVETKCGVYVSRTPPVPPSKHADDAIRRLRRWTSTDVVFDVGANDGRTVLRLQEQLSSPRIFAFEPVASSYRTLVERTSRLANVRAFQVALGAAAGPADIYVNEIAAMSSFSPAWTAAPMRTERVEVTTVDQVMADERIDFVHFLKIDTEGHDLEVLAGAEGALRASRIAIVQVEVGIDQVARPLLALEQARCHLASRGYFLYGVYNQCRTRALPPGTWPSGETAGYRPEVLAYCDALFLRADL